MYLQDYKAMANLFSTASLQFLRKSNEPLNPIPLSEQSREKWSTFLRYQSLRKLECINLQKLHSETFPSEQTTELKKLETWLVFAANRRLFDNPTCAQGMFKVFTDFWKTLRRCALQKTVLIREGRSYVTVDIKWLKEKKFQADRREVETTVSTSPTNSKCLNWE